MANVGVADVQNGRFAQEMKKFLFYSKSYAKPDGEIEENDSLRTPKGSTVNIYDKDGNKFETKVVFKGSFRDYLLLESDEKLAEDVPYVSTNVIDGTHYLIMGYRDGSEKALPADALLEPSFLPGTVTSREYDKNGHYGGTSAEMPGFSGGPAYQKLNGKEFLGFCLKGAHSLAGTQCYQIVAGHSMENALIYLEEYEKMPKLRLWWVLLLFFAFYVEEGDSKKKKSTDYYQVQYYAPSDYYGGDTTHVDPLQPYYGVVYGVTAPVIIIFIYVAAVGLRGLDVRRWMVLNVLLWMIWYGMLNADGADHSPWKGWLGFDPESSNQYNTYFQELAISTITGSLCLLYIESIVSSILYINHPKAQYSIVYNIIWFIFYIPVLNGIQLFCFIAKYQMTTTIWWYDPIDCLLCVTYVLAYLLWLIHFIATLVLSCLIPIFGRKHKDPQTEFFMLPVLKMWLVFIYGIIPKVLIIPYVSVPLVQFLFTNFADEMLELMQMFTSDGFGISTGGLPSGGNEYWLTLGLQFMGNRDYFMLYLPFIITILSVLCFPCFYRPLLILISCGRICSSSQKKPLRSPPPSYPGNVEEKKIPPS
ncbi:unnamed protein product, partial [Mesorhabditis belari]|uniref:Uncharacterized protein n=1 Tax=Mesorhabditis belari TaxID=2138241 RepID=A0AAF3FMN3_9BILA